LQLANGLALFYVTFIPFPTAVLAVHLDGADIRTAVAFYCGTFVMGSFAFNLLVETIVRSHLLRPDVDAQTIARLRRGYHITFMVYLSATFLALVAPWVALVVNVGVRLLVLSALPVRAVASPKATS
ncbi:MAG TPA: hypothetical protein VNM36_03565, partial [Gemmatimonadaceae bacterium]|nr:hypothetical protein [Gemmatimonadaceae bacterium]